MKIAFLSTFYPFRGGIAQFSASMYREIEKNHEVKAFTFSRQYPDFLFPGETQYVTDDDIADEIPSLEILDTINPFSYLKTAKQILAYKPDVVIMHFWMSFFGPSLGTVARKLKSKCKVISVLHNVIPHEKKIIDKPFTKYFLNQNHGFISLSTSVKNDLFSLNPKSKKVIQIGHPHYDHFGERLDSDIAREELNIDKNKKTILYFGFIRDYKGLDLLIDAFEKLDDSFQLLIAGESYGSFEKYQQKIEKSKFKNNIHPHIKYIGDEQVPVYFSAADICVLPYKSATQSGITSISHHFNLPIIATDVGGLKESVIHKKNGLIVPTVSSNSIAKAIQEYFQNNYRQSFIKEIEAIRKENSWENFAMKTIEFVKTL